MNIGLVYSGGISKCAYQLGFTQALAKHLDKCDVTVKAISGASMGIFTGYALSARKLDTLEDVYKNVGTTGALSLFWQVCMKKLLYRGINTFFSLSDRLEIPVCFPMTCLPILSTKYFWINKSFNPFWKKYIYAATNFPFLCGMPKFIDKRLAIDGGAVDNIPLYPLIKKKEDFLKSSEELDLIIVLHFNSRYNYRKEFRTTIPVLDLDISINNDFKKQHFDFSKSYIDEMLSSSREYGDKICNKMFYGATDKNSLIDKINDIFLAEHEIRQWHESIDGLVSTVNSVGRLFRRESSCSTKLY